MAARRRGLAAAQLAELARKLETGGRPRVRLSGPQFPPDTVGTVVRIGRREVDGEDFVTVRARVRGVVDELAFSPSELSIASKAITKASGKSLAKTAPKAPTQVPASARTTVSAVRTAPAATAGQGTAVPARPGPVATEPATSEPGAPGSSPPPAPTRVPDAPGSKPRLTRATRRPTATPPVTITIVSTGVVWAVSVDRGARCLVKKAPITPGAVTAIATLLAHEGVAEAVAAVNDTARNEAEAYAARLRTELAEVQAVLDSHRPP